MAKAVELSILIVSYNAKADLARCLHSLHHPPPTASREIVVIDNASSDGSADAARQWPDVHVIEMDRNFGFAVANNVGFRASTGQYVLLLNSDTVVPPGAIDRLVAELEQDPDVAVVGPRLVDAAGEPELSFGRMITPLTEWQQKRLARGLADRDPAISSRVREMTTRRQRPDWVSGACLLVRRNDAQAVGFLDERYFMYTEDVDFCAAIRARGRSVLYAPEIEVVHLRGRSVAAEPAATSEAYRRSHLAFYEKHHPQLSRLLRLYRWLRH